MKNIIRLLFVMLFMISITQGWAEEYKFEGQNNITPSLKATTAGCSPSSAYEWLDINNVRGRINAGGDMWWDLPGGTGSKYFIPANGSATSLFSGALWIGGLDVNNQLKLAALRYRQIGNDFWTGPLTIDGTAAITADVCAEYDKQWKITRAAVDEFLSYCDPETGAFIGDENYTIPTSILEWPAHGDADNLQSYYLAPFYDVDGDGEYNPSAGDYPYYDIDNSLCHTKVPTMDEEIEGSLHGSILADQVIKGDQTIWWVFNDKGNSHTESSGSPIGFEIRAQAFAFATNDEVNNMSFYSYEIINRSTFELTNTYFCPWADTDLGYGWDDFVGCDVARGLGYCYNGNAVDGSGEPEAYGSQPPAIGVDFFQGPYLDADGLDNPRYSHSVVSGDTVLTQLCDVSINGVNFGNGIVDDERFGMRRFLYHNNQSGATGDPSTAPEYYNMLRGVWKDGQRMLYGGTAHTSSSETVGPECDFMFPGDTDPCNWGTGGVQPNGGYTQNGFYWTEETCGNDPNDRRFMQSAGPFTLKPGAVNYITFGVPWARATSGGAWASVELLRTVDDKAQALFDNCFKVIDGPNAPDLTFKELDRQLIVFISNSPSSNNYQEGYEEYDANIPQPHPVETIVVGGDTIPARSDSMYRFEGYKVYQLLDETVGADDIYNADKARLVFQCDIKNGVSKLVNFNYDEEIGASVPRIEVNGADDGISHSFVITEDQFATSDVALVNHKQYYFLAIAYAYNNFMDYSDEQGVYNGLYGQKEPYLAGRKNIQVYSAIPHKIIDGTVLNSSYGDGVEITRIAGRGNGGNELELKKETIDEILSKEPASETNLFGSPTYPIAYNPTYQKGYGPVDIKIVNPLNVKKGEYELWMDTLYPYTIHTITGNPSIQGDSAQKMVSHWYLKNLTTGDVFSSDTVIGYRDEKLFVSFDGSNEAEDLGFSIQIEQVFPLGPQKIGTYWKSDAGSGSWSAYYEVIAPKNGMITSSLEFADSSKVWLDGIQDVDVASSILNWIRSGTYDGGEDDASNNDYNVPARPYDPGEDFEKIVNRTWTAYNLCALSRAGNPGPVFNAASRSERMFTDYTSSVDIVFTADKSKWTRCPVIEMSLDNALSEGNAKRFHLRKAKSVDKNGVSYDGEMTDPGSNNPEDANYIASQAMGWFPGYAINVETGARLNMLFGEDSFLPQFNGRDMLFNPSTKNMDIDQHYDPNILAPVSGDAVFGGRHFVYVMNMSNASITGNPLTYISQAYDAGKYAFEMLDTIQKAGSLQVNFTVPFYSQMMYVGLPMPVRGQISDSALKKIDWIPEGNDARVRIRLSKPYDLNYAELPLDTVYPDMDINNYYPMYRFKTDGSESETFNKEKISSDLDLINIVPNPYYAYSSYESNALDNRVRITNLPETCVVTIYNMSGTKIRQFKKDELKTSIDWDLKNFAGVPIASGVYLIHVKSDHGERVIKWFGTMRAIDLNTF